MFSLKIEILKEYTIFGAFLVSLSCIQDLGLMDNILKNKVGLSKLRDLIHFKNILFHNANSW